MNHFQKINLNQQEKKWILAQRINRLSDNQEALIYPMGAERYLASNLSEPNSNHYNILAEVIDKHVLVIPGYGNTGFLFAKYKAKSVTVYDKDPVTIAWVKAFKKYYHYQEFDPQGKPYPSVGELLDALTDWYPPLLKMPKHHYLNVLRWAFRPKSIRKNYLLYMLFLVRKAIKRRVGDRFEWNKSIQFFTGEVTDIQEEKRFDTAFVPYLLGVQNGIKQEIEIIKFIKTLKKLVPHGPIIVTPSQNKKEFYLIGKQYLSLKKNQNLAQITALQSLISTHDPNWFRTQGLIVFGQSKNSAGAL